MYLHDCAAGNLSAAAGFIHGTHRDAPFTL